MSASAVKLPNSQSSNSGWEDVFRKSTFFCAAYLHWVVYQFAILIFSSREKIQQPLTSFHLYNFIGFSYYLGYHHCHHYHE